MESSLLAIKRVGRDALGPITLAPYPDEAGGPRLNAGQRSLVELILTTRNRVIGVNGLAGTGKTTVDYRNGERGIVEEISADAIAIRRLDGTALRLPRSGAVSLDYSYAVTGHSAQGLDASRVVFEKESHSRTTDRRSFYTDLTRARDVAVVVTDSIPRLAQRARLGHSKTVALEFVRPGAIENQSNLECAKE